MLIPQELQLSLFSCITYSNIKIKQKLVIKFMLIVLLIEKKVLYCLGLIEE